MGELRPSVRLPPSVGGRGGPPRGWEAVSGPGTNEGTWGRWGMDAHVDALTYLLSGVAVLFITTTTTGGAGASAGPTCTGAPYSYVRVVVQLLLVLQHSCHVWYRYIYMRSIYIYIYE